jgi:hypothetical protein
MHCLGFWTSGQAAADSSFVKKGTIIPPRSPIRGRRSVSISLAYMTMIVVGYTMDMKVAPTTDAEGNRLPCDERSPPWIENHMTHVTMRWTA